jgi:hypothetical protein
VDLPGDPLEPGCRYEKQFRQWNDGRPPSVYAHIATDPFHPGKLSVQDWFYYTFNDFTDKHESDWEMAQVDFDASSAAEAFRERPYEVDLSQHAGGERSDWTGTKLQRQGTHPVIYDATGSHANYFNSALYLGRGAREGFGCDDTREATHRLRLRTVLLPDTPTSASAPLRPAARGGTAAPDGPHPELHQPGGRPRLQLYGALRSDPADAVLFRPRGQGRRGAGAGQGFVTQGVRARSRRLDLLTLPTVSLGGGRQRLLPKLLGDLLDPICIYGARALFPVERGAI